MQAAPGHEDEALVRSIDAFPILGERLDQKAGLLSGGQQQMLAMARAYTSNPKLILVDEASLGLAPVVVDSIFGFLARIASEGAALLIVDQFVARALAMATGAYVLNRGELVFSGRPTNSTTTTSSSVTWATCDAFEGSAPPDDGGPARHSRARQPIRKRRRRSRLECPPADLRRCSAFRDQSRRDRADRARRDRRHRGDDGDGTPPGHPPRDQHRGRRHG